MPALLADDQTFDVISGAAGCIGGLLALHAVRPGGGALGVARRCGEHLVDHAVLDAQGSRWIAEPHGKAIAGFSHGTSGIAWALAELYGATGDAALRDAALDAVRFERTLFDPAAGNWPNNLGDEPHPQATWCHGAPGIGLARAAMRAHISDSMLDDDLEVALRTTVAVGFDEQQCLCHGSLGNLELLVVASERGVADLRADIAAHVDRVLGELRECGWRCGVPLGVETPGLLTGVAGIGYALLRRVDPSVPSVLTMQPPQPPATRS